MSFVKLSDSTLAKGVVLCHERLRISFSRKCCFMPASSSMVWEASSTLFIFALKMVAYAGPLQKEPRYFTSEIQHPDSMTLMKNFKHSTA